MKRLLPLIAALVLALSSARTARAQDTHRDATWQTVTTVTAVTALGTQIFMPRVFYAEPETTVGWRARWHLSALAPTMTLTVLTFANEYALKDAIKSQRPGCDDTNQGTGNCQDYGSLSSHAFLATSSFGPSRRRHGCRARRGELGERWPSRRLEPDRPRLRSADRLRVCEPRAPRVRLLRPQPVLVTP
jgi:hypothetical protein